MYLLARSALIALLIYAASAAEDPLAGVRFADGRDHHLAEFAGQDVVVIWFSGQCPNAARKMREDVKALQDYIEKARPPWQVVCITPDRDPENLRSYAKEIGLDHTLLAHDPANLHKISLNNIWQCDALGPNGKPVFGSGENLTDMCHKLFGTKGQHRYPSDGLEGKARDLWWLVERDQPQAIATLVAAARSGPIKADAERLLTLVKTDFDKRIATLVAAPAGMDTYEGLEAVLPDAQNLQLAKPVQEHLKALTADPAIKKELEARRLFRVCQAMSTSNRGNDQKNAWQGFAELAKRMPDTVYGKRAGAMKPAKE